MPLMAAVRCFKNPWRTRKAVVAIAAKNACRAWAVLAQNGDFKPIEA